MPLNSPTNELLHNSFGLNKMTGKLYVVATPIGNMEDITLRALNVLEKSDFVAAEDTRNTGRLLSYHHIKAHLVSYHEHNEEERTPVLIKKLKEGSSIALVSDAGTPLVSDPGYRLIKEAIANNITVIPVPGVSAAVTALSVSGFPTDSFVFIGFPPRKKTKRHDQLQKLAKETRTIIFYESPKRILCFIEEIIEVMGDRPALLAREMTKFHEEFVRGTLSEILDILKARPVVKGELTLILGRLEKSPELSIESLRTQIAKALETKQIKPSLLAKDLSKKYGLPKSKVYEEVLRLKEDKSA